jgi:hypothetical protein
LVRLFFEALGVASMAARWWMEAMFGVWIASGA